MSSIIVKYNVHVYIHVLTITIHSISIPLHLFEISRNTWHLYKHCVVGHYCFLYMHLLFHPHLWTKFCLFFTYFVQLSCSSFLLYGYLPIHCYWICVSTLKNYYSTTSKWRQQTASESVPIPLWLTYICIVYHKYLFFGSGCANSVCIYIYSTHVSVVPE